MHAVLSHVFGEPRVPAIDPVDGQAGSRPRGASMLQRGTIADLASVLTSAPSPKVQLALTVIKCFEEQVILITEDESRKNSTRKHYDKAELEALGYAFRFLSQLHSDLGHEEEANLYVQRCREVQIASTLQGLAAALGQGHDSSPHTAALRDQLLADPEAMAPVLLQASQFPVLLHALGSGGHKVAHHALHVLLVVLAQPLCRPPYKRMRGVLAAVSALVTAIIKADVYGNPEAKVLRVSVLVLRYLAHWVPSAFDEHVPLLQLDHFLKARAAPTSSLLAVWAQVWADIRASLDRDAGAAAVESHCATRSRSNTPPPAAGSAPATPSALRVRMLLAGLGRTRSASLLTDTSTLDSSETDTTLTFASIPSDEEDGPDAMLSCVP